MWTSTPFTERFGCRYPIVQGPMGGGASTPELVAAVSGAGGMGSLGCYHMEPAAILRAAADIRRLTDRPFNLNLWIPREREDPGSLGPSEAARALARLQPYRAELGLPPLAEPPRRPPSRISSGSSRPCSRRGRRSSASFSDHCLRR